MSNKTHELRVSLILDQDFGAHINDVIGDSPIWICNSATNQSEVQKILKRLKSVNDSTSENLTIFEFDHEDEIDEVVIDLLPAIEERHAWTILDVYGADANLDLEAILITEYRATEINETPFGFRVTRQY
jgi:hypothetical protein